jgi:DtxR family Mn-dependent transcriptional regulator
MESIPREALEDLLEAVWLCGESGQPFVPARHRPRLDGVAVTDLLSRLSGEQLLTVDGALVGLTPAGEEAAAMIVRRHRLAERLYTDLLCAHEDGQQSFACRFEHILSEEATEAVCTLLGHPPTCPHGKRIPPGECCRRAVREVVSVVRPLPEFPPGSTIRIVFITPRFHQRLDRLHSFGVLPGALARLHQKQPAFVLRVGATEVAIEQEVAGEIFGIRVE